MKKTLIIMYITAIASVTTILSMEETSLNSQTLTVAPPKSQQITQQRKKVSTNIIQKMFNRKLMTLRNYWFPVTSIPAVALTTPVIFYDPTTKKTPRILLVNVANDSTTIDQNTTPAKYFGDINSYNLSLKKKYLLINTTTTEGMMPRVIGGWLGKQVGKATATKLIDVQTQQEIASFNYPIITWEFSPDEKTLLIAGPQKSVLEIIGKKASTKGASVTGERVQRSTGEILRYDLFDIKSKTILQTFENVQSIMYTTTGTIFIKHDDNTMEEVTIKSSVLSLMHSMMNLFVTQPKTSTTTEQTKNDPFNITTNFDDEDASLTFQTKNKQKQKFDNPISYTLSPHKKYILITQKSEATVAKIKSATGASTTMNTTTKLIDLNSGEEKATFENMVTYEFIPNEEDDRLLVLSTQPKTIANVQYDSTDYQYRLYDTNNGKKIFTCPEETKSAYFKSHVKLIVIDKQGVPVPYNPKTALSEEQEKQALNQQIIKRELQREKVEPELKKIREKLEKEELEARINKESLEQEKTPNKEAEQALKEINEQIEQEKQEELEKIELEKTQRKQIIEKLDKQIEQEKLEKEQTEKEEQLEKEEQEKQKALPELYKKEEEISKQQQEYQSYYEEPVEEESFSNYFKSWFKQPTQEKNQEQK